MAKKSAAGKIAGGLAVAALAASAAATYYFAGPGGKKHRKQVSAFSKKAKGEMLNKIKQMKTVSAVAYSQAAKEVLAKYKQAKHIAPGELAALASELKGHWDKISKDVAKLGAKKTAVAKKKLKR